MIVLLVRATRSEVLRTPFACAALTAVTHYVQTLLGFYHYPSLDYGELIITIGTTLLPTDTAL